MRIFIVTILLSFLAPLAHAETVRLRVVDGEGAAVAGAVVMLDTGKAASGAGKVSWPLVMAQKNMAFDPYILIVPAGSEVEFPNLDRVRHHVYSFSKGNKFELKLYGREEARKVALKTPGIVAVGCNIHDMMIGYIRVVDTAHAAQTDANGEVVFETGGGATQATVWHPDAAPAEVRVKLTGKTGTETAVLVFNADAHNGH